MLVYGVGAHLSDMLDWHPELSEHIERVFDKDKEKTGKPCPGLKVIVESPESLRQLPAGTEIAVAAIRFLKEISQDLHRLNPGLVCRNIDDVYAGLGSRIKPAGDGAIELDELLGYMEPDFVEMAYESILRRAADPQSRKKYRRLLMEGKITRRQIIREMACSEEARAKGVTLEGLGDDEVSFLAASGFLAKIVKLPLGEFLETCYRLFLKREPDFGGWDRYMSLLLENQVGKMDVIREILASPEGRSKGGRYLAIIDGNKERSAADPADEVRMLQEKLGDLTVAHRILLQEISPAEEGDFDPMTLPAGAAKIYQKLRGA